MLNTGYQASNYTMPIGGDSVPQLQPPYLDKDELGGQLVSSRDVSNEIFNTTSVASNFGDPTRQLAPTQFSHIPLATAINPFFPPKQIQTPSPHKRTREGNSLELGEMISEILPNSNVQENLYLELRALVSLVVMRTRYCVLHI
jgi:hypothetical protein